MHRFSKRICMLGVSVGSMLLLHATHASAAPSPPAASGDTAHGVLVAPEAMQAELGDALADFRRVFKEATGAALPMVADAEAAGVPWRIVLELAPDAEGIAYDGYRLQSGDAGQRLIARTPVGLRNGLYGLARDWIGVRWFMPGPLYEVIPDRPDLPMPRFDATVNPDFYWRIYSGISGEPGRRWLERVQASEFTGLPRYGFQHNLFNIISFEKYGESHPEYFAEIDGRRRSYTTYPAGGPQPCFTNPDVIAITIDAARAFFDAHPEEDTFSLCPNDSITYCECADCGTLDQPYRVARDGWRIYSDSYYHYVSRVAEAIAESHPDRYLGTYAYWGTDLAPRHIDRLPDNVLVQLTQDTAQYIDPDYEATDRAVWQAWSAITPHLSKYDYYNLGQFSPRYFPDIVAEDLRFIRAHNAEGMYNTIYPNWAIQGPQTYLFSRMLWDVSLDPDALLDEYMTSLFGTAAPHMHAFYDTMAAYWAQPREGVWFQGLNWDGELNIMNRPLIEKAWGHLADSLEATEGLHRERVQDVRDHFQFSYCIVKGYTLADGLAARPAENLPEVVPAVLDYIPAALGVYENVWCNNPIYMHFYYLPTQFDRRFDHWRRHIEAAAEAAYLRVAEELGEPARTAFRDTLAAHPIGKDLRVLHTASLPVATGIVIDGDPGDWQGYTRYPLVPTQADGHEVGDLDYAHPAGTIRLAADAEALYLLVAVADITPMQTREAAAMWLEDCIQIGLSPNPYTAEYGPEDAEIGLALGDAGPMRWRWQGPDGAAPVEDIRAAITNHDGEVVYEVAIPWAVVGSQPAGTGAFGLSVLVNDAAPGRLKRALEFGGGMAVNKDPRQFRLFEGIAVP